MKALHISILITVFLIIIYLFYYHFIIYENFQPDTSYQNTCSDCVIKDYNEENLFTPINMIISDIQRYRFTNKNYLDNVIVLEAPEMKTAIDKINERYSKPPKNFYYEIEKFHYIYFKNLEFRKVYYDKINFFVDKTMDILKRELMPYAMWFNPKTCFNKDTCVLKLSDFRVILWGKSPDQQNNCIEGQIQFVFEDRGLNILVRYIASDENTYTLHKIYLEGFEFSTIFKTQDDKPISNSYPLNIRSNPVFNKYGANKGYYVSDEEKKPSFSKRITDAFMRRFYNPSGDTQYTSKGNPVPQKRGSDVLTLPGLWRCYGKNEITKPTCEAEYSINGDINKVVGVWDRPCLNDWECPFYMANKNYPNMRGKCLKNGMCEMPVGVKQISPRKYLKYNDALCYNCKENGYKCCNEQKNIKNYPNLDGPDYMWPYDLQDRLDNKNLLINKGLNVI